MQTIEYFQDSNINRDGIELMDKHIARYINKGKPVFHVSKHLLDHWSRTNFSTIMIELMLISDSR